MCARASTQSRAARAAQHRSTGVWAAVPSAVGAPPGSGQSWTMRSPMPTPARTPAPALARSADPHPSPTEARPQRLDVAHPVEVVVDLAGATRRVVDPTYRASAVQFDVGRPGSAASNLANISTHFSNAARWKRKAGRL